jgi:hypothetical protein
VALIDRALRELLGAIVIGAMANGAIAILRAAFRSNRPSHLGPVPLDSLFDLLTFGGLSWWILLGLLATTCAYPLRALFGLRRRNDAATPRAGELRRLTQLGAASSVGMMGIALLTIQGSRALLPDPRQKVDLTSLLRLQGESAGWTLVGVGLVILAALWGAVGLLQARREPREAAPKIAATVAIAAIVSVLGASLIRFGAELNAEFTQPARNAEMAPSARHQELVARGDPLLQGRSALLFVAAIGAAGIVIAARRRPGSPPLPQHLGASVGLFAIGLAAFALTRGVAHDAHHPPPFKTTVELPPP